MLNVLVLKGRLTKNPELRKSGENATSIVNFDIAVDNTRKEADGTRGTSFFQVMCFNSIAENVSKHLRKGSMIALTGSIQQRNFVRKDGSKGSTYEVIADSIEFLDPKPVEKEEEEIDLPDDDLPFSEEESPSEEPKKKDVTPQKQPKFDPFTGKPLKATKKEII